MKKLLVFFMVLALAAPAMAADNLEVSGEVRVRAWDKENFTDFNDDGETSDKDEYFDQRFRLQTVYKANDNVKGVVRFDFAEDQWGSNNSDGTSTNEKWGGARYGSASELQIDRAYMDITTGPVNIIAGQHFSVLGQAQVYRPQKPGIQLKIKTPLEIKLGYMVEQDEDAGAPADEQNLSLSLMYKTDAFSVEGFYGQQSTATAIDASNDQEDTKTVYGVNVKTKVGPVDLNSELAMFGGDNDLTGAEAIDYVGMQFNVDADMKLSEMVKLGADLIYSTGTDDANEEKIALISDPFGRLNRSEGGSGNNIFAGDLSPLGGDDVFDPFNDNLGAMGLGVDAVITPIAGFDVLLHLMYLSASEDAAVDSGGYDTALIYNVGLTYEIAPKTKLAAYYTVVSKDAEGNAPDDQASNIGGLLKINF